MKLRQLDLPGCLLLLGTITVGVSLLYYWMGP